MRKLVMVQMLKGTKPAVCEEVKPLEVFYIAENRSELLFEENECRVYVSSGVYGNYQIVETTNPYGVTFRKTKALGF